MGFAFEFDIGHGATHGPGFVDDGAALLRWHCRIAEETLQVGGMLWNLLGADDKAGIAEILTAVEYLQAHPEIPRGDVWVGFTPDEEIGRGADRFPLDSFPAKWAYTVDGGELGEEARWGIAEATRAIDLLQERRTALISAAVTGQIDVRGLLEQTEKVLA